MDEIEKLLRANQGSTLTKQIVEQLLEMISDHADWMWESGMRRCSS